MSHKHSGKLAIEYSLPPNVEFLHFPRSDGDSSQWPLNQEEEEDEDGNVNFYMPLADDKGTSLKWLHGVGQKVAEEMGLPSNKKYAFASWPDGYRFFDHHKGAKASPRHDAYVIGCTTVSRFRSVPEIVPHALWLMTDASMDRANCHCKYCSKRKQSAVSQQYGFPSSQGRLGSVVPSSSPSKRQRRNQQPYAVVQRTKALKAQSDQAQAAKRRKREKAQENQRTAALDPPRETVPNERTSDLRAAAMRLGPERSTRRYHRQGELVWCSLGTPIRAGPPGDDVARIELWPAIIQEWRTATTQIPRVDYEPPPPGPIDAEEQARLDAGRPRVPAGHFYAGENASGVEFVLVHRTEYKAQLLAINANILVLDDCVLPYSAWAPSQNLLAVLRDIPKHTFQYSRQFCPPETIPPTATEQQIQELFTRAAAPYSVALEAAAELAATWAVTDEWSADVLNADGEEEQETQYQGLWWGPERIWVGDLVQLKMPRKQLHSPLLREPFQPDDHPGEDAGDRGVFMHLHSLKHVETILPDNVVRNGIIASGELYEVAEDPLYLAMQIPQEKDEVRTDEVRAKILDAVHKAQEREVEEAARGVEGLHVNGASSGPGTPSVKGKEREDATMRPASDVAPAPAPAPTANITLPNPDPTVPIDQTVAAMRETLGDIPPSSTSTPVNGTAASPLPRTDIGGLSGPTHVEELLPPAPPTFAFRPLIKEANHEASVSLDLLGGRYYPGIIQHSLLAPVRQLIFESAMYRPDEAPTMECEAVLALEGIAPGVGCAMSPTRMIIGRKAAIVEAEAKAVKLLQTDWARKGDENGDANGDGDGMEGVQGVNGSVGPEEMKREGTWTDNTTPEARDQAAREGLEAFFGDGNAMDVDGYM
ncbi:unnamed protein product [Peniophora sp. CBMAI 1063]|nr:unnamed protein product [Peniophora sp. CBMAI 1063]